MSPIPSVLEICMTSFCAHSPRFCECMYAVTLSCLASPHTLIPLSSAAVPAEHCIELPLRAEPFPVSSSLHGDYAHLFINSHWEPSPSQPSSLCTLSSPAKKASLIQANNSLVYSIKIKNLGSLLLHLLFNRIILGFLLGLMIPNHGFGAWLIIPSMSSVFKVSWEQWWLMESWRDVREKRLRQQRRKRRGRSSPQDHRMLTGFRSYLECGLYTSLDPKSSLHLSLAAEPR